MELEEAKKIFEEQLPRGVHCLCCGRFDKVYPRKITSSMAWTLLLIYDYYKKEGNLRKWLKVESHLKSLPNVPTSLRGDFSKLRYWKLIRQKEGEIEGIKTGLYKITEKGINFCERKIRVSKIVNLHNGAPESFSEEQISIIEALGDRFSYKELMGETNFEDKLIPTHYIQGMHFEDKSDGKIICYSDSGEMYYLNTVKNYCNCPEYKFSKHPKHCHHLDEYKKRDGGIKCGV